MRALRAGTGSIIPRKSGLNYLKYLLQARPKALGPLLITILASVLVSCHKYDPRTTLIQLAVLVPGTFLQSLLR